MFVIRAECESELLSGKTLIRLLLRQSDFLPETTVIDGPEYEKKYYCYLEV